MAQPTGSGDNPGSILTPDPSRRPSANAKPNPTPQFLSTPYHNPVSQLQSAPSHTFASRLSHTPASHPLPVCCPAPQAWEPDTSERIAIYRELTAYMKEHFGDDSRGRQKSWCVMCDV